MVKSTTSGTKRPYISDQNIVSIIFSQQNRHRCEICKNKTTQSCNTHLRFINEDRDVGYYIEAHEYCQLNASSHWQTPSCNSVTFC